LMSPALNIPHSQTILISTSVKLVPIMKLFHKYEFNPSVAAFKALFPGFCSWFGWVCEHLLCFGAGCENTSSFEKARLPVLFSHYPDSTSVKNMEHWNQVFKTGQFKKYDFGSAAENQKHYGRSTPPLYDLSKITIPLAIYYGTTDSFVVPEDAETTISQLRSRLVETFELAYGHGDFCWAEDAYQVLYPKIEKTISKQLGLPEVQ